MRRSSSVDLKRSPNSSSRSSFQELLNGKWRVLTSPALLSSAVVSALGIFMLVKPNNLNLVPGPCSGRMPVSGCRYQTFTLQL